MNAATLQTVSVVFGLFVSAVTIYFLAKSNTRDQVRQRNEERERAVAEAKAPLIADNAQLAAQVMQLRAELQRRDDRITELEDRLWGRGPK